MGKSLVVLGMVVTLACVPQSAFAWGTVGHRLIMRRAIELLPPAIKPFFEQFREEALHRGPAHRLGRSPTEVRHSCACASIRLQPTAPLDVPCLRLRPSRLE